MTLKTGLAPFAAYADGIGMFTGADQPLRMGFESHVVGERKLDEQDFARAKEAYKALPALADLLTRARDQLSAIGGLSPDADPLVHAHERGVATMLSVEIGAYMRAEGLA